MFRKFYLVKGGFIYEEKLYLCHTRDSFPPQYPPLSMVGTSRKGQFWVGGFRVGLKLKQLFSQVRLSECEEGE